MHIQHEIMSFNPDTGSIIVRYFSDEVPNGLSYNIDIPIINGKLAPQSVIDELIQATTPVGQLERLAKMCSVEIPQYLLDKIPEPPEPPETLTQVDTQGK